MNQILDLIVGIYKGLLVGGAFFFLRGRAERADLLWSVLVFLGL